MDLRDLPQFRVLDVEAGREPGETRVAGVFSHVRGVRNDLGYLYRSDGPSIIAVLDAVPSAAGERVTLLTSDASLARELRPGVSFPWLDCYWRPYHLAMVLGPADRWARLAFGAEPAHFFELGGVQGWHPVGGPLPDDAVDLGVRAGAWDHEHCELCRASIGGGGAAEGYVDPDKYWLCVACYERYAARRDISFALEE